jgi:hypothetical protein
MTVYETHNVYGELYDFNKIENLELLKTYVVQNIHLHKQFNFKPDFKFSKGTQIWTSVQYTDENTTDTWGDDYNILQQSHLLGHSTIKYNINP